MKKALVVSVLLSGLLAFPAAATVLETATFNGTTYMLLDRTSWTGAETEATSLGGHLVTIENEAENSWLASHWGMNRNLWIGFTDQDAEGTFLWISGSSSVFTSWNGGEPNNAGDEDYAYVIAGLSLWNDVSDIDDFHAVVEIGPTAIPEPSTATLLGLGLGAAALVRRKYLR